MNVKTKVQDLGIGDKFQYVIDWDVMGTPIMSGILTAHDKPIVVAAKVLVPVGPGDDCRMFMSDFGKTVEVVSE